MKRTIRIMFLVSLLVLVAAATSANAATYQVKKGDTLSKIGKKYNLTWQTVAKANVDKVKNPHRIFPGQVLTIPEKIAKTAEGYTPIKSLGRRRFGKKRDVAKAIEMLLLPKEVKQTLIAKVKSREFEWAVLKQGDKREQMVFGKYRVQNKVIMDFAKGHLEAVRRYSVEHEGWIFYLEIPLKCDNPTWWSEELPPPPTPPPPPAPEPEPEPEPVPPPAEVKKKKKLLAMLEPPPVVVEEARPEIPLPLPTVVEEEKFQPDFEAWSYAGYASGVQANRDDWTLYRGGNISLFPYSYRLGGGILRIGPAYQWVGWNGQVGDIIDYRGQMSLFGGEAQYITGSTKSQFKLYYGKKTDDIEGQGDLAPLMSRQWNRMLAVEPSYQWWKDGDSKWFTQYELGGRFEFDLGGAKSSSWDSQKIDDPRTGQGVFMVRGKANVYKFYNDNAVLTFQLAPGYEQSPKTWFAEPRVGIKFFGDIVEPAVSYKWNENSQNDSVAGHIVLNASELIKRVWQMFKPKQEEGGEKK